MQGRFALCWGRGESGDSLLLIYPFRRGFGGKYIIEFIFLCEGINPSVTDKP